MIEKTQNNFPVIPYPFSVSYRGCLFFFLQNFKAFISFCRCPMLSQLPTDKVLFCFKYCASGVYVQFSFIFVKLVSLVLWMLASYICSKVNFVSYVSMNEIWRVTPNLQNKQKAGLRKKNTFFWLFPQVDDQLKIIWEVYFMEVISRCRVFYCKAKMSIIWYIAPVIFLSSQ